MVRPQKNHHNSHLHTERILPTTQKVKSLVILKSLNLLYLCTPGGILSPVILSLLRIVQTELSGNPVVTVSNPLCDHTRHKTPPTTQAKLPSEENIPSIKTRSENLFSKLFFEKEATQHINQTEKKNRFLVSIILIFFFKLTSKVIKHE